jgi:hypothetical protein
MSALRYPLLKPGAAVGTLRCCSLILASALPGPSPTLSGRTSHQQRPHRGGRNGVRRLGTIRPNQLFGLQFHLTAGTLIKLKQAALIGAVLQPLCWGFSVRTQVFTVSQDAHDLRIERQSCHCARKSNGGRARLRTTQAGPLGARPEHGNPKRIRICREGPSWQRVFSRQQ